MICVHFGIRRPALGFRNANTNSFNRCSVKYSVSCLVSFLLSGSHSYRDTLSANRSTDLKDREHVSPCLEISNYVCGKLRRFAGFSLQPTIYSETCSHELGHYFARSS